MSRLSAVLKAIPTNQQILEPEIESNIDQQLKKEKDSQNSGD
jgi:hypothetical protein